MTKRIGLLVGREWSFPPRFIDEVNGRNAGVTAEYVSIGAVAMDEPCPYDVIIDRISHEVPFYRSYLKQAVLQGKAVVNNPFMWTADDKFFGAALVTRLGVASPKTVALPNKSYVPGIVPHESLRNLKYPLDWDGLAREIGMPCILKDAHGGGWKEVHVCHSLDDLIHHYKRAAAKLWSFCGSSGGGWQRAADAIAYLRERNEPLPDWWDQAAPRNTRN